MDTRPVDTATLARKGTELCHAVADGHEVLPDVLALLARCIGTDVSSLSSLSLEGGPSPLLLHGSPQLDERELAQWDRLLPTHPFAAHLATAPQPRRRLTEVVSVRALERTEVFQVCLAPKGARFQAAFLLERGAGGMTLLSLWRDDRDFSDDEIAPVELLTGALAASMRVRENLEALRQLAGAAGTSTPTLTRRQSQVVELVAMGCTNDQIAHRLGLSTRTVRKHLEMLFARTGARSRTELAVQWREGARSGAQLPLRA
jgi:DNA-binding CsgD family transcriptional regulator